VADIRALQPREKKEEAEVGCPFCHPFRKCHKQGFDAYSCPRVETVAFLPYEDSYPEGWNIHAVTFRSSEDEFLLCEIQLLDEDEDEGEEDAG
jgi:hypothetical protein